jgi:hypothetical protein
MCDVVITDHAKKRALEHKIDLKALELIVHKAEAVAPRWPELAAALDCGLPVDPVVKFFEAAAVVTTLLPHGVPLQPDTEVVHV